METVNLTHYLSEMKVPIELKKGGNIKEHKKRNLTQLSNPKQILSDIHF